jgi:AhpD family alkylhydroperoxidase
MRKSGLEPSLSELVVLRASEINSCADCVVHSRHARAKRESEDRLHLLIVGEDRPSAR